MKRRHERGASAVEFALVLPLLLVILFGIIEFGFILYDKAMITNASREGARAGIVLYTPGYGRLSATGIQNV
ncbi:MAG TPA: TadE/TadG family type IV pilus assembly protein, partial [Desulfuromonadales bacterium]|nr:TadE/TadG family type IV pilus assembly protein [Desulfuromonadales bacterium]